MRSIFHEILARYLGSDQHAFESTSRELWPVEGYVPLRGRAPESQESEDNARSYGEFALEPQQGH